MSFFTRNLSRRAIMRALVLLPTLSLMRGPHAAADPDAIVEVNGWILKRSDLA